MISYIQEYIFLIERIVEISIKSFWYGEDKSTSSLELNLALNIILSTIGELVKLSFRLLVLLILMFILILLD